MGALFHIATPATPGAPGYESALIGAEDLPCLEENIAA
jgi:hypothetical protein